MVDRETIVEAGDGGAAGIVAGLLVVALIVFGLVFFASAKHSQTIDLDVPAVTVNVAPGGQ